MIRTETDIRAAIEALHEADERLRPIILRAGPVPLRRSPPGLRGLAGVIVAQQVSKASADAIFGRFASAVDLDDAAALLAAGDEVYRFAGLSRPKERTIRALASAIVTGELELRAVAEMPPEQAIEDLCRISGIGRWTAECFLLFSAGHPDIFPAGDLALAISAAHGLGLEERPKTKALAEIALAWSPHRSTAARLLWAYYAAVSRRDATPAEA